MEAVLCTYETVRDRFQSRSERNRFYRGLHGYRRTVRRNDTVYRYEKPGLLGDLPHIKVADAVFIVARPHLQKVAAYFDEWAGKVRFETIEITVEDEHQDALRDE